MQLRWRRAKMRPGEEASRWQAGLERGPSTFRRRGPRRRVVLASPTRYLGQGEHAIVAILPTAQNIEVAWEYPAIRRMFDQVGAVSRYLHVDKRGTGCSDRRGRIADLDERVDDLRAVMDHAGIQRALLFGASEGGPMTLLFAVAYPERVQSVTLLGSGATVVSPDLSAAEREQRREGHRRFAALWGTPDSPVAAGFARGTLGRVGARDGASSLPPGVAPGAREA